LLAESAASHRALKLKKKKKQSSWKGVRLNDNEPGKTRHWTPMKESRKKKQP